MYPRQQAGVQDRPIRFRDVAAVRAGCCIAGRGSRQNVCRFCRCGRVVAVALGKYLRWCFSNGNQFVAKFREKISYQENFQE